MQPYPEIKRFVQETLGCTCSEQTFNKIDYRKACDGLAASRINVGDRLLIYIVSMNDRSDVQAVVSMGLERGVLERDNKGFNRFRLVLVASRPDKLRSLAEQAFSDSGYKDEKTHLHLVDAQDVVGF